MADHTTTHPRVRLDGKFFRLDEQKFYVKGVCYGPFAPNLAGESFPALEQAARDCALVRELGSNLLRVYEAPPRWFLDLAWEHGLKLLIDIPWPKNYCFLDARKLLEQARHAVREAVRSCAGHAAVFAFSVVNEIPAEIVRWSGAQAISDFIDELVGLAKALDPDALCTFGNYPPTEYLRPRNIDFLCFNLYLHQRAPFENYLARLQSQAGVRPLLLGEFGVDSLREGEAQKSEWLHWQIESAFRAGLAGTIVYSFTDDWFKEGRQIEDWHMGLTTRDRKCRESYFAVQRAFRAAPHFPLARYPKVSVVVASYNGGRTLKACLDSLLRLNYPDYELILVDDGSTDATSEIASLYQEARYLRQPHRGLAAARNTGLAAAQGEIVAFTDSDCRADEDWLYYLVAGLVHSHFVGIGGHNLLPGEDSAVAAAVLVSPGGPAHVMLTDRVAEHIPGCNMAFYKWALEDIEGFDPVFRTAGDDVDLCWRLQQRGYEIGFSPAGFVWHYRRSTVQAYLRQQRGYGEAEALLVRKHPENFNAFGRGIWRGRIYTASKFGVVLKHPIIYHGVFATGFFQSLYNLEPASVLMLFTSLEYYVTVTVPLLVLSTPFPSLLPVALASVVISLGVCVASAMQAELPKHQRRFWSKPLIALLFLLQPMVRGWARYQGRLHLQPTPPSARTRLELLPQRNRGQALDHLYYWSDQRIDRVEFLHGLLLRLEQEGWPSKADAGWSNHDIEILGHRWNRLQLSTVSEDYPGGKKLVRCRLRTAWSLPALVAFWAALAFELLVIGVAGREQPWLWMILLAMPLFGWYLEQEKRDLQRLVAAFLDETAHQRGMIKLRFDAAKETFVPLEER
jgi:glycosyltransferase involved in cell wall biosynthesis